MMEITDKQISEHIAKMIKEDPVKVVQFCLLIIGREILETNAKEFNFKCDADLKPNERYEISMVGMVRKLRNTFKTIK